MTLFMIEGYIQIHQLSLGNGLIIWPYKKQLLPIGSLRRGASLTVRPCCGLVRCRVALTVTRRTLAAGNVLTCSHVVQVQPPPIP